MIPMIVLTVTHDRKIMIPQVLFGIMPNEPENRISAVANTFHCFRNYTSVIFSDYGSSVVYRSKIFSLLVKRFAASIRGDEIFTLGNWTDVYSERIFTPKSSTATWGACSNGKRTAFPFQSLKIFYNGHPWDYF